MTEVQEILGVVTGGSQGFGKSIAISFYKTWKDQNVQMILIGRNEAGLEETKRDVESLHSTEYRNLRIIVFHLDLSDLNTIDSNLQKLFQHIQPNKYHKSFLFNNSGSLGPLTTLQNIQDSKSIQQFMDLNISSCLILCAKFLREFSNSQSSLSIINISSLAAVKPFYSWSLYCSAKAARDMMIGVIAEETKENTQIRLLSYAPGPMDTDMQRALREESTYAPHRQIFGDMKQKGQLVNTMDSATKLNRLLIANKYENGSHIDFFDETKELE